MRGTQPLADILWLYDNDKQVRVTLLAKWEGICMPVMLTGQVTVLNSPLSIERRHKRSIHWSIKAVDAMGKQLHATSVMTLQNGFVTETLLVEDQRIYDNISEQYCTVISAHTGTEGNLTKALNKMK